MPESGKRSLHPLLLERGYWRNRLQELKLTSVSILLVPRPELSSNAVQVEEFRIRTHDGIRLYGLRAVNRIASSGRTARVRVVGPSDLPRIDPEAVELGEIEFIFQEPAGRKLEDRVLDVLRVCQIARGDDPEETRIVRLVDEHGEAQCDEFLIASQLLADEAQPALRPARATRLDDSAGFSAQ